MKVTGRLSLALLFLLALAYSPVGAVEDTRNSTKLKEDIADELVDIADKASDNELYAKAVAFLDEALELAPEHRKATREKEDLQEEGTTADTDNADMLAEFKDDSERYRKKAALGYCALFFELIDDKDTATVDAWLERAYQLHAEETDEWVEDEYRTQVGRKNYKRVYRMLGIAGKYQLTEDEDQVERRLNAFRDCVAQISVKSPMLMQCRTHDMCYYLSLPKDWSMDKEWPIYVAQEGAGSNFQGMNRGASRGNNEFIVVSCCTFSNTNSLAGQAKKYPYTQEFLDKWAGDRLAFDEPGLLAVMKEVRELFNGTEKICITGFSGGGILTWHMVFKHPDKVTAAVPACANFASAQEISDDAEAKKTIIVHAFQGDKDKHKETMLDAQWEAAKKLCDENGYEHVKRDIIPGGHIACHKNAREVFLKACGLSEE